MFEEFVEEDTEEKNFTNNLGFVAVEHDYDNYEEPEFLDDIAEMGSSSPNFGYCKNITKVSFSLEI